MSAPENVRQADPGQAFPDPHIDVVQRASLDPNQNLVLARLGIGHIFVAQNFRTTEFVDADGFHGSSDRNSTYHRSISKSHFGPSRMFTDHRQGNDLPTKCRY